MSKLANGSLNLGADAAEASSDRGIEYKMTGHSVFHSGLKLRLVSRGGRLTGNDKYLRYDRSAWPKRPLRR